MPAEATSFVGRRHELAEVRKKLAAARLISLVGPGGVGKTRLAIRVATGLGRGFPGGAWMAELAELRDPALVSNAVMAALDLRDQAATEPLALVRSYLRDKELLLVLDNCEHVIEDAAQLVSEVIMTMVMGEPDAAAPATPPPARVVMPTPAVKAIASTRPSTKTYAPMYLRSRWT